MKKLNREQRARVLAALCEGCSVAAVVRMTGVAKVTILKLIRDAGAACLSFEDEALRNLPCRRIECDELWGFVHCKQKRVTSSKAKDRQIGNAWTWCGLDADSKLLVSWLIGDRDGAHAEAFMHDLASRLRVRPQISTDALGAYASAVLSAFDELGCDYAIIQKIYAASTEDPHRYSPPRCVGCYREAVMGRPLRKHVSTSRIERFNLTVRMQQRRWTRLTNGHSRRFEYMESMFAIHSFYYNWIRRSMAHRMTPAEATGLAERAYTFEDMVKLLEVREQAAIDSGVLKRGKYRPRIKKAV